MQIAVVLDDEVVKQVDQMVPGRYRSRAEVVRRAVDAFLSAERRAEVDRLYLNAYVALPQAMDDIDTHRVSTDGQPPAGWADLEW